MSAVAPGKPLQPKLYLACIGRGFGNVGGDEAVRVASQEAPDAIAPSQTRRKSESNPGLIAEEPG
jgi:hypothetical protein